MLTYFCVLVLLFMSQSATHASGIILQTNFKFIKGYVLTQGTQLKKVTNKFMSRSYCASFCSSGCNSAILNLTNKTCITYMDKFYNSTTMWKTGSGWILLFRDEPVQYADWTLVFRAQKNIQVNMSSAWENTGASDDNPLTLNGCYRLDNLGGCTRHFRSDILDTWINIKQVKFALYVNGSEVRYIVFNGTSSTRDSWFSQGRVQTSTWTSLKTDATIGYFSYQGLTSVRSVRRFNIRNDQQQTCSYFESYVTGVDLDDDVCATQWNLGTTNFPQFLYSTLVNRMALFSTQPKEYGFADVLAVFVKF